jgi:CheY-like chemotaxis protein
VGPHKKCDQSVVLLEPEIEPPAIRQRKNDDFAPDVEIVSVSPSDEDHDALERCLVRPWILRRAFRPEDGLALLRRRHRTPAVICERDLRPRAWKVMLRELSSLPNPPLLIVSSLYADAQLWAEALNLGAYDVLAKPLDGSEVARALHSAWVRWKGRLTQQEPGGHDAANSAA